MAAIAERGLDIHITEMDVAMVDGDNEQTQATVYQRITEVCWPNHVAPLSKPGASRIVTHSEPCRRRSIWTETIRLSPAYQALQEALGGG